MTLVEFLTARLDEDEAFARTALEMGSRVTDDQLFTAENMAFARRLFGRALSTPGVVEMVGKYEGAHPAPTSPVRVLAEVDAKRRIVASHQWQIDNADRPFAYERIGEARLAERHVRYLALPYADHPDYREEWRP